MHILHLWNTDPQVLWLCRYKYRKEINQWPEVVHAMYQICVNFLASMKCLIDLNIIIVLKNLVKMPW